MPTFVHSKNTRLAIGAYDTGQVADEGTHQHTAETAETTVYGDGDRKYLAGRRDHTFAVKGVADFAALPKDTNSIAALLGSTTRAIVSFCPEGYTVGKSAQLVQGTPSGFNLASPASDVVKFDATLTVLHSTKSDHGTSHKDSAGLVLFYSTSVASTSAAASQDNGAATSAGYAAHAHLFAGPGGGSITVQVQHSSAGVAWSDLTAFSAFTGFTADRKTSSTAAVKRYVRAAVTAYSGVSTSSDVLITFARR